MAEEGHDNAPAHPVNGPEADPLAQANIPGQPLAHPLPNPPPQQVFNEDADDLDVPPLEANMNQVQVGEDPDEVDMPLNEAAMEEDQVDADPNEIDMPLYLAEVDMNEVGVLLDEEQNQIDLDPMEDDEVAENPEDVGGPANGPPMMEVNEVDADPNEIDNEVDMNEVGVPINEAPGDVEGPANDAPMDLNHFFDGLAVGPPMEEEEAYPLSF